MEWNRGKSFKTGGCRFTTVEIMWSSSSPIPAALSVYLLSHVTSHEMLRGEVRFTFDRYQLFKNK
jgi:hypothetical protein